MEKLESASVPPAELVRKHLCRVLASPHFRTSKRSSEFLSFVVDETLEGRQTEIKERTIGAAVFGRPANYETPADPIVRVKANEVRKRLAQYYGESGAGELLQIELPAGAYVPAFHWRNGGVRPKPAPRPGSRRRPYFAIAAVCAVLLAAGGIFAWKEMPHATALDEFWAPVVHGAGAPLVCVGVGDSWMLGSRLQAELDPAVGVVQVRPGEVQHLPGLNVSTGTLESVLALSLLLARKGVPPQLRFGPALTIQDVGAHPVLSIGAFNNPWTIRGNADLRFSFEGDGADENAPLAIRDRLHPGAGWVVSERFPWKKQTIDYAVISRLFDPVSGNVFITIAGINTFGSRAAGEFLTEQRYWKDFAANAPAGWQKKNLQIVLETKVVGMTPSPPRVLARHFW